MPVSSSSNLCRQQRPQPSHSASHWPRSSSASGRSQKGLAAGDDGASFMTSLSMVCYQPAIKRGLVGEQDIMNWAKLAAPALGACLTAGLTAGLAAGPAAA